MTVRSHEVPTTRLLLALALSTSLGCRSSTETPAASLTCPEGTALEGATCAPRFDVCAEGQLPTFGGGCLAIGATCAAGFASDGKGSCAPVLPAADCPKGQLAVPGDAACRPIDTCGDGPFGDVPDGPNTVFVDPTAKPGGDGTRGKPYQTFEDAVALLTSEVVVLAAGRYMMTYSVEGRPLTIRGRCASMVELYGDPDQPTKHVLQVLGDITIRDVAITGPYIGLGIYEGTMTLERVWIHDTGLFGVEALGYAAPTAVVLRDSLVEAAVGAGVRVGGATATIERSVLRDTQMHKGLQGTGVTALPRLDKGVLNPAKVKIDGSVLSHNRNSGVLSFGAAIEVAGSVVRGTRADDKPSGGPGVSAQPFDETHEPVVVVRGSVLEDNETAQLYAQQGTVTVEHTVARRGVVTKGTDLGGGFYLAACKTTLVDSVSELHPAFGVVVEGGEATIERVLVRDVGSATIGAGINVSFHEALSQAATCTVRRSRVDRVTQAGLLAFGSDLAASEVAIFDTKPLDASLGDGAAAQTFVIGGVVRPASLSLERCLVARSRRAAVTTFGGSLFLRSNRLECSGFDVSVERRFLGTMARDYVIDADASNACGCAGATTVCKALSNDLAPIRH